MQDSLSFEFMELLSRFAEIRKRVWEGNERKHAKNIDALKLYLNILRKPSVQPYSIPLLYRS